MIYSCEEMRVDKKMLNFFQSSTYCISENIGGELHVNLAVQAWIAELNSANNEHLAVLAGQAGPKAKFKSNQYFWIPGLEPNCQI